MRHIAATMLNQSEQASLIASQANDIISLADRNSTGARTTLEDAKQLDVLASNLDEIGRVFKLGSAGEEALRVHAAMPEKVQTMARELSKVLDQAVDQKLISLEDLFDRNYVPIPNTRPQKFTTKFDSLTDKIFPPVQEGCLERIPGTVFALATDLTAYAPTHNNRFSKPHSGNFEWDMVHSRSKRNYSDNPVLKRASESTLPFLNQTYRRDTGEIMHCISSPVFVKGRHWGGAHIGYVA